MIKINKELKSYLLTKLYSPNNELIGEIENNEQMMDIRNQIAKLNLSGYYYVYKNEGLLFKVHIIPKENHTSLYSSGKENMHLIEIHPHLVKDFMDK